MSNSYMLLIEKRIDNKSIEEIIFELGFESDDLEDRYFYFNECLSIRGCWFSLRLDYFPNKTLCVATTFPDSSYHDVEMQITVLKSIKNRYGGKILDSKSEKQIIPKNGVPQLSEFEIAIKRTYLYFLDNIQRVEMLIEEVDEKTFDIEKRSRIQITNPSIIHHNTLVPF